MVGALAAVVVRASAVTSSGTTGSDGFVCASCCEAFEASGRSPTSSVWVEEP